MSNAGASMDASIVSKAWPAPSKPVVSTLIISPMVPHSVPPQ